VTVSVVATAEAAGLPPAGADATAEDAADGPADGAAAEGAVDGPPEPAGAPDAAPDGAGVTEGAGAYVQPGVAPDEHATSAAARIGRARTGRRRMAGG